MQTFLEKKPFSSGIRLSAFAGLAFIASIGTAAAKQAYQPQPHQYYGLYQQSEGGALSRQDRADYDRSGTRGRMGLGASPYHPEGPGNVSN